MSGTGKEDSGKSKNGLVEMSIPIPCKGTISRNIAKISFLTTPSSGSLIWQNRKYSFNPAIGNVSEKHGEGNGSNGRIRNTNIRDCRQTGQGYCGRAGGHGRAVRLQELISPPLRPARPENQQRTTPRNRKESK